MVLDLTFILGVFGVGGTVAQRAPSPPHSSRVPGSILSSAWYSCECSHISSHLPNTCWWADWLHRIAPRYVQVCEHVYVRGAMLWMLMQMCVHGGLRSTQGVFTPSVPGIRS